jgi:hypothetical protein
MLGERPSDQARPIDDDKVIHHSAMEIDQDPAKDFPMKDEEEMVDSMGETKADCNDEGEEGLKSRILGSMFGKRLRCNIP